MPAHEVRAGVPEFLRAFTGQRRLKFNKNGLVQRDENGEVYEEWAFDSNLAMFRLNALAPNG